MVGEEEEVLLQVPVEGGQQTVPVLLPLHFHKDSTEVFYCFWHCVVLVDCVVHLEGNGAGSHGQETRTVFLTLIFFAIKPFRS